MPLPWKKAKVTRISRIVADLQSPKRGGSLVVETGFPTSLIDLFVKNRDRLKKPSMRIKKKKKKTINDPNPVDAQVHDPIITPNPGTGLDNLPVRVGPIGEEVKNSTEPVVVEEEEEEKEECVESIGSSVSDPITTITTTTTQDENHVEEGFVGGRGGDGGGGVLIVVLKVFLVVVLALSTKKLAVGITLSAFLLFFLEYVGKRWVRFLRPCSQMDVRLRSMVNWVSTLFWLKKEILVEEENHVVEPELVDGTDSKSSSEEIEILELKDDDNNGEEEFLSIGPELEFLSRDKKWGFLSMCENKEKEAIEEDGGVLVLDKIKRSKRAKIKAKIIKNFVPKKLRSSKKGKQNCKEINNEVVETISDVSSFFEFEDQEDQRSETRKEGVNDEIPSLDEGLQSGMELSMVSEEKEEEKGREERKGTWICLTLVLISLAGLFWGRIVALLLTISWCFMLKLIGTTQGRLINMTVARPYFAISSS